MNAMSSRAQYSDEYWWSNDGLRLHFRDYPGRSDRPPIICIAGLTRNARDFAPVAERLTGEWRVICVDLRGRGDSSYAKDPLTYVPLTYVQDIEALLANLGIDRFVAFGTSLGGIVTMLLAATSPHRLAGALLNDIGPVIEPAGVTRIRTYLGKSLSWPTWVHAGRALADQQRAIYPDYTLTDWIAMAKRLYHLTSAGRVVPDYDAKISEALKLAADNIDLWPAFAALSAIPTLIVRGALSDLLSAATAKKMMAKLPDAKLATIKRVGHAPLLDEPVAAAAIDVLLAKVAR
jgi:pimeloyl-ACP methyl ester carboxylesterase